MDWCVFFIIASDLVDSQHRIIQIISMEISTIGPFLDYYDRVRDRTLRLINCVPQDKMDFTYMPGKYTIADMIRHFAAIERYMFAENVQMKPSRYIGCGPEITSGYKSAIDYMNEMHRQSLAILNSLSNEDLRRKCPNPGGEILTWKWLRAMIEHEVHHRGELYIYLNLLGIKTPPMYGLTAEEVQEKSVRVRYQKGR